MTSFSVHGVDDAAIDAARLSWRQNEARRTGVHHDGHMIDRTQLVQKHQERLLQKRQLVGLAHRPGDVEQEDQIVRRELPEFDALRLQSDVEQFRVTVPGAV